jgi:hypothetical protein
MIAKGRMQNMYSFMIVPVIEVVDSPKSRPRPLADGFAGGPRSAPISIRSRHWIPHRGPPDRAAFLLD